MSVTLIYGSDSGTTEAIAKRIGSRLEARVVNIAEAGRDDFETCDLLVLGSPTYGLGDLQSDWDNRMSVLQQANLDGKTVALFGTGDQTTYPDTFVDAMGILYDQVVARGARVIGFTPTNGYDFTGSLAVRDGQFVGLALDEDGQSSLTGPRITQWVGGLVS